MTPDAPPTPEAPLSPDTLDELPEAPAPDRSAERPFTAASPTLGLLADVEIEVTVELGRRRMPIGEVARLDVGSVLVLDTLAGEPLVVFANGRRIATGEAVVVDGKFGVRIQQLVSTA